VAATITRTSIDHHDVVEREYASLVRYCRRLDWDAPEDIAQEAATRTLKRLAVGDIDDIGAYMRTTARHIRADIVRSRAAHPVVVTDDVDLRSADDPDVAHDMAMRTGIGLALRKLNARELQAFRSSVIDEASTEQIAAEMHMSVRATTSLIYRARQKMRTELERLKAKGMMAAAGPVSFLRHLYQQAPEALTGAAATGLAALAILAGAHEVASQPNHGSGTLGVVGTAGPAGPAAIAVTQTPALDRAADSVSAGDAEPSRGRRSESPPPTTAAPPLINPRLPSPRTATKDDRPKPIDVEVGGNCRTGAIDRFYTDPWTDDAGFIFDGNPPPGGDIQLHSDTPLPEVACNAQEIVF
jgi:RNA polymerase sigma factor (sigma-70 family)